MAGEGNTEGFNYNKWAGISSMALSTGTNLYKSSKEEDNINPYSMAANSGELQSVAMSSGNPWAMAAGAVSGVGVEVGENFVNKSLNKDGSVGNEKNYLTGNVIQGAFDPLAAFKTTNQLNKSGFIKDNEKVGFAQNAGMSLLGIGGFNSGNLGSTALNRESEYNKAIDKKQKESEAAYKRTATTSDFYGKASASSNQIFGRYKKPSYSYKEGGETCSCETYIFDKKQYYKTDKNIKLLQQGGVANFIPDGAYHHTMNNLGDKGLPVVDNDGIKMFEIETEELIMNKESSLNIKELQKLYNETGDNKYLNEIGNITKKEILKNTKSKAPVYDCLNTGTCKLKN